MSANQGRERFLFAPGCEAMQKLTVGILLATGTDETMQMTDDAVQLPVYHRR
jgi:hypothetical protein